MSGAAWCHITALGERVAFILAAAAAAAAPAPAVEVVVRGGRMSSSRVQVPRVGLWWRRGV